MYSNYQSKLNLDEVVFENRNQQYGAYALRKQYPNHLIKSMLFVLGALLILPLLSKFKNSESAYQNNHSTLNKTQNKPVDFAAIEIENTQTIQSNSLKTSANATLKVVADNFLKKDIQQQTTIISTNYNNTLGQVSQLGLNQKSLKNTVVAPEIAEPIIKDFAELMPSFNQGKSALEDYLQTQLNYPNEAYIAQREGKVVVAFVVDETGMVSQVEIIKGIGFGCDVEALRVIKNMPKWKPAMQNGKAVAVRLRLPIKFSLN